MQGVLFSFLAGILISLQSIFNTRLSEKLGLWQTSTIVHGLGFIVSLLLFMVIRDGSIYKLNDVNKLYLLGGVFGAIIVYSVMKGITVIGPTYAVSILLISQLIMALIIDTFGLFGTEKLAFTANKSIGLGIMIIGILVFKLK
ncbi:DMT family transporter [Metabacillus litoralis]|uniref:DMT family transporter n=1 Tax=Metabacillus litoralis TaxID=152268 RepID=UPI000EF5A71E|nr:DMT family transporter [Metabacillus litoralis]